VGKSCAANNRINILDAESSAFSWIWNPENLENGRERNPEFPHNYISFIKENMDKYDVILTSTHKAVRDCMRYEGIPFMCVVPELNCKNEYMIRYLQRGSSIEFIEDLYENWARYIEDIVSEGCPLIWLEKGKYLKDALGVFAL
jgi:hypothetical protein